MNKTNTTDSTLNFIKSVCAERDRKERDRLRANKLEMEKREEAVKRELVWLIVDIGNIGCKSLICPIFLRFL